MFQVLTLQFIATVSFDVPTIPAPGFYHRFACATACDMHSDCGGIIWDAPAVSAELNTINFFFFFEGLYF